MSKDFEKQEFSSSISEPYRKIANRAILEIEKLKKEGNSDGPFDSLLADWMEVANMTLQDVSELQKNIKDKTKPTPNMKLTKYAMISILNSKKSPYFVGEFIKSMTIAAQNYYDHVKRVEKDIALKDKMIESEQKHPSKWADLKVKDHLKMIRDETDKFIDVYSDEKKSDESNT